MKLEIDIHEKDYQSILNSGQVPYGVVYAIMNGTPLPKGHGRLIDADELIKKWYDDYIKFMTREEIESMDGIIENAPTIIERDKET